MTAPRPGRRRVQPTLLAAGAVVIGSIVSLVFDARGAQGEAQVVTQQLDLTAGQAVDLAAQIQAACRTAELTGPICETATRVAADPVPGPAGPPGAPGQDGRPGVDGRGVTGTSIVGGSLVVSYSDGTAQDVGVVVGRDGAPGVGITATLIEDGELVVVYGDGRRVVAGPVVGAPGAPGRGVASVDAEDGRLAVTYTDGAVEDAGPLPSGPAGVAGDPAASVQSERRTFSDGSVQQCTRSGGPDSDPEFDCDTVQPASDERESAGPGEPDAG